MSLEGGADFEQLLEYIRDSRGFDFTGYKRGSLVRRVAQRCKEVGFDSFAAYRDFLEVHAEEFGVLFDKILINVTEFFRDKETWDFVAANVVPRITAKKGQIRIWCAATSSGEEAYSAAILFCEAMGEQAFLDRVKIYATDVDEQALTKARTGSYLAKDLASLGDEVTHRYFEPQGDRCVFKGALRRTMIFGRHDLTQDAPISRLDLLICRNALIYFTAETQGRILARFHLALNDDGYLFLGRAEMLLTHAALFIPVEMKERVFTKATRLELRDRLVLLAQAGSLAATTNVARQMRVRELATEGTPNPQLVIDSQGVLVSVNRPARELFEVRLADTGRALKDMELSYRPVDLRTPVDRVTSERQATSIRGVELKRRNGAKGVFDIHLAPLIDEDGTVIGVAINYFDISDQALLRTEIEQMKRELQSSKEELETTNEELQSTVEELETTNEELQSTNQELETLNEELESTNSELQTINTDLTFRRSEVERLNRLLLAITGNIELGAAVLDRRGQVQVWNERAADLWGVRSDEVLGRSFFDLDIGLPADQLKNLIESATGGQSRHEELIVDATTRKGRPIHCRVLVHTMGDGVQPSGVVVVMEELKP